MSCYYYQNERVFDKCWEWEYDNKWMHGTVSSPPWQHTRSLQTAWGLKAPLGTDFIWKSTSSPTCNALPALNDMFQRKRSIPVCQLQFWADPSSHSCALHIKTPIPQCQHLAARSKATLANNHTDWPYHPPATCANTSNLIQSDTGWMAICVHAGLIEALFQVGRKSATYVEQKVIQQRPRGPLRYIMWGLGQVCAWLCYLSKWFQLGRELSGVMLFCNSILSGQIGHYGEWN